MLLLLKNWKYQLALLLLLAMGLWFNVLPVNAAINDQIHFQGKVVNSDGTNVSNGDYSFTFTIYDAASSGTNLWTETKTITVTDGIFSTDLGSSTDLPGSIDFNTDSLYLGVNFNSDGEMSPRIRLTAVPYAFNAEKVAGLTVTDTTGTLTIPAATIAFSGDNDVTLTSTDTTNLTLPTTGTLATLAGSETFSNKTIASSGLTIESGGWIGLGSGAGRIVFSDATPDKISFADTNVGIGTTDPGTLFEVVADSSTANIAQFEGSRAGNNVNVYIRHSGAVNVNNSARLTFALNTTTQQRTAFELVSGYIDTTDSSRTSYGYFSAADNGSYGHRMALVGSNLGIGILAPTARLDVNGTASTSATLSFRGPTDPAIQSMDGENLYFRTSAGGDAGLVDRLTLLNDGNFGIGTTTVPRLLTVAGGMRLNSTATPSSPDLGDIYTNADGNLYFYNGSTWDDLTGGGASLFSKSGTNLSPTTSGDDLYLASGELLGVAYDPTTFSGAVAAFNGNIGIGTTTVDSKVEIVSGDTTRALQIIGDSITTNDVIDLSADGLTTGYALTAQSTSSSLTTGGFIDLDWTPGSDTTATGDLFKMNLGANATLTGNMLALYDNSSDIFLVSTNKITSAVPHEFTAAGDVSMAYDLILTNQTAATIESYGPLTIKSGESFENLDLTLDPSGTGAVVVQDGSDLELYADQKLVLDVDDSGDSYIHFDNTNNRVEVFADGSERFRFTASGNNESNGSINTTLSDLAENYPTMNAALEPGEVVMIETNQDDTAATGLVELANHQQQQQVIGVVSSKPGIILGGSSFLTDICQNVVQSTAQREEQRLALLREEYVLLQLATNPEATLATTSSVVQPPSRDVLEQQAVALSTEKLVAAIPDTTIKTIEDRLSSCEAIKQVPVALAGRVPVKVDHAQGFIKPGDLLAVSPTEPGSASKAKQAGWVIGRALTASNLESDTVMMFVNIAWYDGNRNAAFSQVLGSSDVQLNQSVADYLSVNTVNNKAFIVSSTNLSVFGMLTAETVAATDKFVTGMLTIDGKKNEITTVDGSPLRLQTGFAAGNIEAFNKKLVFTADGKVISENEIFAKRFAASSDARGSLYAQSQKITVEKDWESAPASINLTPDYKADVWVSDISKDGFTVNVDPVSPSNKVYWWAVW